jgi:hypothetical protein
MGLTSVEMNFFRRTIGYTLFDHKMNERLLEVKVKSVEKKLRRYKSNWLQRVTRMNNKRMLKIGLNYRLNGGRPLGRSLKRLFDEQKQVY